MKKYVFKTPDMCSTVAINANNFKHAKIVVKNYLCVARLPKGTTITEYLVKF